MGCYKLKVPQLGYINWLFWGSHLIMHRPIGLTGTIGPLTLTLTLVR